MTHYPDDSDGEESTCNEEDLWVRSLGWEDPLEKGMDRGAWWAIVHGVAKS